MRIIILNTQSGRIEIAVETGKIVDMANVLESAESIDTFYVDGMNVKNQQQTFCASGFIKWISPIQT